MKAKLSKEDSRKIIIGGAALVLISFVVSIINLLNIYAKGAKITSCLYANKNSCGFTGNLLVSRIGAVIFWIGMVVAAIGIITFISNQKTHK